MFNMIKSDLFRMFKGIGIYIIIIVIIGMSFMNVYLMSAGQVGISFEDINDESDIDLSDIEYMQKLDETNNIKEYRSVVKEGKGFPLDKNLMEQSINLYYFFIAVVVIIICSDFSNKSIKNTLSSAITRKKYYFSKLIFALLICTILIVFNNCFTYLINIFINGKKFSSDFGEIIKIMLRQLPMFYGIISLLVGFAFCLRKTALFNTIVIPFASVEKLTIMGITNIFKLGDKINKFEMEVVLNRLVKTTDTTYIRNCIILGIVYIIIFNVIGYFAFKKVEIK